MTKEATMTVDALAPILARAETLYRDVRLDAVRTWKEAHPGRHAIGHMPVWAPRELIVAAGMLPVGIMGGGEDVEIIKGDAYYQSYICHIPRSTIEMSLNGGLDPLAGMIFPSICDVIRNLSGMWQMIFPDRPAWYLDMPQSFDDIGRSFFLRELEHLAEQLSEVSGIAITDEALRAANIQYDENRRLLALLYEGRRQTPWTYPTSEVYLILRAGNLMPVDEHNQFLRDYMAAAVDASRPPIDNARVVLVGAFCEQPPLNLIRTLERSGCYVVDDDLVLGNRLVEGDVDHGRRPIEDIVDAFMTQSREAAFLYKEEGKGQDLIRRVEASKAEGVLFCAPSFCDPALLDQPMLVNAIEAVGIPHTAVKYAENTGQFQVIREQAGTFADSIKLWGAA